MSQQSPHQAALASLERKLLLVRDHVTAVGKGYKTGLYLYGTGGVGKSFTVLRHLERLEIPYRLYNSRMTAKALFLTLMNAPDAVHVLEDMERVTRDPDAQGVLRSALWSQPGHERVVTWATATEGCLRFTFRGGLILISNRPLADLPELRALATRIEVYHLDVSEVELTALMRELASKGYSEDGRPILSPEECVLVTERLLKECRSAGCTLDLRLQQKAFQTYRQFAADSSISHWEDMLAASVREATCHFRHEMNTATPEARKAQRRNVVREVMALTADAKEQERAYSERTGASRADFYRRKREVESGEFNAADDA
ncbi:MAG TPA: hypothetical protein VF590_24870 [Isosphaeraceae bacterium]|jgi:hypothetical protein